MKSNGMIIRKRKKERKNEKIGWMAKKSIRFSKWWSKIGNSDYYCHCNPEEMRVAKLCYDIDSTHIIFGQSSR
jgi:hypothetical protein